MIIKRMKKVLNDYITDSHDDVTLDLDMSGNVKLSLNLTDYKQWRKTSESKKNPDYLKFKDTWILVVLDPEPFLKE